MRINLSFSAIAFVLAMGFSFLLEGCYENECEGIVCDPCQGTRFVIRYQDSTAQCIDSLEAGTMIYGFAGGNTLDTTYEYTLFNGCEAGFIVEEGIIYHIKNASAGLNDIIQVDSIAIQTPVEVAECCLCYPPSRVILSVNGLRQSVVYEKGQFENLPYVRTLD